MRFLIIFMLLLFVGAAHASHNPRNPDDYMDSKWNSGIRNCAEARKRLYKQSQVTNQTDLARQAMRDHLDQSYRSCTDKADRDAKRRHRPMASAPKPDADQAPAPESQTVQPPKLIPSMPPLVAYQKVEHNTAKASGRCIQEMDAIGGQGGRGCAKFIQLLELMLAEQQAYRRVFREPPPPSADREEIDKALNLLRATLR